MTMKYWKWDKRFTDWNSTGPLCTLHNDHWKMFNLAWSLVLANQSPTRRLVHERVRGTLSRGWVGIWVELPEPYSVFMPAQWNFWHAQGHRIRALQIECPFQWTSWLHQQRLLKIGGIPGTSWSHVMKWDGISPIFHLNSDSSLRIPRNCRVTMLSDLVGLKRWCV